MRWLLTRLVVVLIVAVAPFVASAGARAPVLPVVPVQDTIPKKKKTEPDTGHSPKKALFRSAVLPGWGQAYNKQYWKIPIIYGALGVTAGIFVYNVTWYKKCRFAFNAKATNNTADIAKIDPKIKDLTVSDLSFYRRQFRQNADYSVLFFVGFWGLNVLDAVVFAHLKGFDVSDELSLQIKGGHNGFANTTGLTLAFDLHKKKYTPLSFTR